MKNKFSVAIIGSGYVGLSLAVALCEKSIKTVCIEKNKKIISKINDGKAHFYEKNFDNILNKNLNNKLLNISSDFAEIKDCEYKIITIGTPLMGDQNFSFKSMQDILDSMLPYLKFNDTLILRSTVGIGTTRKIAEIVKSKLNINVAYCPERVAAGKMLEEIHSLPQIIGGGLMKSLLKVQRIYLNLLPLKLL